MLLLFFLCLPQPVPTCTDYCGIIAVLFQYYLEEAGKGTKIGFSGVTF
jgi:hypothetical protein